MTTLPSSSPESLLRVEEVDLQPIRAQGAGGQNINKVSNAIHLRFDIAASSLPDVIKARLLALSDQRVSSEGVVVIKAQEHRSLERNTESALARLREMIADAAHVPRPRRATRPSKSARIKRVDSKVKRGQIKLQRGPVNDG